MLLKEIISDLYLQKNRSSWSHSCLQASRLSAEEILLLLSLIHPPLFSTQVYLLDGEVGLGVLPPVPGSFAGTRKEMLNQYVAQQTLQGLQVLFSGTMVSDNSFVPHTNSSYFQFGQKRSVIWHMSYRYTGGHLSKTIGNLVTYCS